MAKGFWELFYFYILDHDRKEVCVEGAMSDDGPWFEAVDRARAEGRDVNGGPYDGIDGRSSRERIADACSRQFGYKIVPPGSIVQKDRL